VQKEKHIMLNQYNLKMPTNVFAGPDAMQNLNTIIKDGVTKITIFTDKGILKVGLLDEVISIIEKNHIEYEILSDIPTEPSYIEAQQVVDTFKALNSDFIIGVGGGSVMDIAKLASVLSTDDYTVKDLLENPLLAKKHVTSLMIPTTAGTGSEATPNSIVGVPEKNLKVGIVNGELIADHVILDSNMIKNLPKPIAAATGVDALAHAIECFTSKKANPISDTFALEALDLILNNIIEACTNPDALEAKRNMLLGSFYAGVAITSSGTTAVHALSYPLGGKYHIAHGVSNAILLTPVMKFNEPVIKDLLAKAYDRVVKEKNEELNVNEKSKYIINLLENIVKTLEIPTSLKTFNVPEEDLEGLVEAGMEVQRLLVNNMREVTPEDARKIYLEII
jgi:alcohol dehydrogenase